jgi:hypothetical protein
MVMNSNSSTDTSLSSNRPSADTISRRAYELWEQEGRPEGADMRHWLQAEQELNGSQSGSTSSQSGFGASPSQSQQELRQAPDTRPLQGTRGAATSNSAARPAKRGSQNPFGAGSSTSGNGQSKNDPAARRRV